MVLYTSLLGSCSNTFINSSFLLFRSRIIFSLNVLFATNTKSSYFDEVEIELKFILFLSSISKTTLFNLYSFVFSLNLCTLSNLIK